MFPNVINIIPKDSNYKSDSIRQFCKVNNIDCKYLVDVFCANDKKLSASIPKGK